MSTYSVTHPRCDSHYHRHEQTNAVAFKVVHIYIQHHYMMQFVRHGGTLTHMMTRKTVPVDAEALALAQALRTEGTPESQAAQMIAGPLRFNLSEGQALALLVSLGAERLREAVLDLQYAAYAETINDEDRAYADSVRKRRSRLASQED